MKIPKVYNKYHKNAPEGAVYIGRGSPFGNPYQIGVAGTREEVLEKYKQYLDLNPHLVDYVKKVLKGKDLVCFCSPKACHGDILLKIANGD